MELENIKTSWNAFDQELTDAETIDMGMVNQLITHKTKTAHDSISLQNTHNIIVYILIMLVVFPYIWMNTPISTLSFCIVEVSLAIGLVPLAWKQTILTKFNLESKKSNELRKLVLKYKKVSHNETIWTIVLICSTMIGFYISELYFNKQHTYYINSRIILVAVLTSVTIAVGCAIAYWQRRRHTDRLKEIEDGLEELIEFENYSLSK